MPTIMGSFTIQGLATSSTAIKTFALFSLIDRLGDEEDMLCLIKGVNSVTDVKCPVFSESIILGRCLNLTFFKELYKRSSILYQLCKALNTTILALIPPKCTYNINNDWLRVNIYLLLPEATSFLISEKEAL